MIGNGARTERDSTGVAAITAGAFHTAVARRDGTVWMWGSNIHGQLGLGQEGEDAHMPVPTPTRVQRVDGIISVVTGRRHTVALARDGGVWAWGANEYGELGLGRKTSGGEGSPVLVRVRGLTDIQAIAAGGGHSLALRRDGTVWAWGANGYGEVGLRGRIQALPRRVSELPSVVAIAAGENHSLALAHDGTVWTWGRNVEEDAAEEATATPQQLWGVTEVVAVAGGQFHSLALKDDGTVWAWGVSYFGQLGNGREESESVPVRVHGLDDVTAIAAAGLHSMAVREDGTAWIWGAPELGDPEAGNDVVPARVLGLRDVVATATGDNHAIALLSDGTVRTWGWNNWGQLGNGRFEPKVDSTIEIVNPLI